MSRHIRIAFILLFLYPVFLFGQKNTGKKSPHSEEEQWEKDSIDLAKEFQRKWIKDSIRWDRIFRERTNPQDSLSYIDKKARFLFDTVNPMSLDSIISVINSNFKTPLHKARAIYYWICTNIKYDSVSYLTNAITFYHDLEKDARHTFLRKTGVCSHYASLFQYMSQKCGIEAKKISGYAKGLPFKYVSSETDHAWNVFRIKDIWVLADPTWGRLNKEEVESFWFNTPSEAFIYSHFPKDSSFQLLKQPMQLAVFRNLPIVSRNFFLSKIPFRIPNLGYFSNANGTLEIEAANTKKSYSLKFTAYPVAADILPEFSSYRNWIEINYRVKNSFKSGFSIIETQVPGKGSWWVKLDIIENLEFDGRKYPISFPNSLMFQVTRL